MNTLRVAGLIGLSLVSLKLISQGFNRRYDAFGQGYAQGSYGCERTSNGITVFSGSYEPDTLGPDSLVGTYALILQGLDDAGGPQWEKRYRREQHGEYLGWADCCDTVAGGGFVVGGSSEQYWTGVGEARLVRFNAQGDSLWSRTFGSPGAFWIGQQVKQTSDGGFVFCGHTDADSYDDAFVIKTDALGIEQWRQVYGISGGVVDGFTAIDESPTGALYMSGSRFITDENSQHWVQRTSADGMFVWETEWGGPYLEGATYISVTSNGRLIVSGGNAQAAEYAEMRAYLAQVDTVDGAVIWENEFGPFAIGVNLFAAKECPNADIIACGVTYEGGHEQGLLLRATSEGDSLWMRNYSYYDEVIDSCRGRFWDVLPTTDGGFIMSGFANGPFGGPYPPGYSQDAWVVKVDSMGCVVPGCDATGVTEVITNLGGALTVFPNPAHGQVQVQIALPSSLRGKQDLQLTLVNTAGQVALVRAAQEGSNELDLGSLSGGVYYIHLSSEKTWLSGTKLVVE